MQHDTENRLEKLLDRAFKDPAHRPDFYRLLLESTVYVINTGGQMGPSADDLNHGESMNILVIREADNTAVIPFFSSIERLAQFFQSNGQCTGFKARDFFELTRGNTLILNPGSRQAKGFDPTEIDALLENGVHYNGQSSPPPQSTVLADAPEPYPSAMVEALTTFFANRTPVKSACLALGLADDGHSRHLVIGVDAEADVQLILHEATVVAADTAPKKYAGVAMVDLNREGDDMLIDLLLHGVCFYDRSWGARLSTVVGRA